MRCHRPRSIAVTLIALPLGACIWGVPTISDFEANAHYLSVLRTGLALYRERTGVFPDSLRAICPSLDGSQCHWLPFGYKLEDAWDRPFLYSKEVDEYELRSVGEDRRAGTADDIVFRPSLEQRLVQRAIGCYRLRGGTRDSLEGIELRLLRDSLGVGRYRAQPPLPPYRGPGWQWIGYDSITVEWHEIHHALMLRLRVAGDSLVGRSSVGFGAASWRGTRHKPEAVLALRVPCADNSS